MIKRPVREITQRQNEIFMFCVRFFEKNGEFPSLGDISKKFVICRTACSNHLVALERKKYLVRNEKNKLTLPKNAR